MESLRSQLLKRPPHPRYVHEAGLRAYAAATYDRFLVSVPSTTFTKMGEAHAALTEALNNPDFSLPEMFRKIKAFAAEAEKLSKIVKDLAALTGDR